MLLDVFADSGINPKHTTDFEPISNRGLSATPSQEFLKLIPFGDSLQDLVAFAKKPAHIGSQEKFGNMAQQWNRGGETEYVFYFGQSTPNLSEIVVVLE